MQTRARHVVIEWLSPYRQFHNRLGTSTDELQGNVADLLSLQASSS